MNTVLIVFLVLVIIFAFFLMVQIYNPSYLIKNPASLNTLKSGVSTQSVINVNQIDNPGSVRYYYEGWFFIKANAPASTTNVLFNRGKNFAVTLTGSTLEVYVNIDKDVNSSTGILDKTGLTPLMTVPNFPFQKWCQLVINVDGTTVDLYIDGKFVQTVNSSQPIGTNTTDTITYGNHYTIGHVTRFRRPSVVTNPQGVWSSYMMGSGQNYTVTNYHLDAQILKNKSVTSEQRLV